MIYLSLSHNYFTISTVCLDMSFESENRFQQVGLWCCLSRSSHYKRLPWGYYLWDCPYCVSLLLRRSNSSKVQTEIVIINLLRSTCVWTRSAEETSVSLKSRPSVWAARYRCIKYQPELKEMNRNLEILLERPMERLFSSSRYAQTYNIRSFIYGVRFTIKNYLISLYDPALQTKKSIQNQKLQCSFFTWLS